jgi:RNA 2',3'-cyclic 3'-phosphodiesterase
VAGSTLRLFIAIDVPPAVRQQLRAIQRRLATHASAVRWVDPEGVHVTLKFLGETPRESVDAITAGLERAARGIAPFELRTADPGGFPSGQRPRVIWLGVGGDRESLAMAHAAVERAIAPLGFPTEDRPFSPHLTLGRMSRDARPADVRAAADALRSLPGSQPIAWRVNELLLMQSQLSRAGARYTAIARAWLDAES